LLSCPWAHPIFLPRPHLLVDAIEPWTIRLDGRRSYA
jgi:hypothetical protein